MNITLTEKDLYAIRRGLRLMVIARSSAKDKSEFPANERMAELMKVFESEEGQVSWGSGVARERLTRKERLL